MVVNYFSMYVNNGDINVKYYTTYAYLQIKLMK